MNITTPAEFGKALKRGPYAWPGGYPVYFHTSDCEALCFACAMSEARQIASAIRNLEWQGGWQVHAQDVNWEDPSLYCAHCGNRIESAYAEDEASKERRAGREH